MASFPTTPGIVVPTLLILTNRYSNFADQLSVNAYSKPPPAARPGCVVVLVV